MFSGLIYSDYENSRLIHLNSNSICSFCLFSFWFYSYLCLCYKSLNLPCNVFSQFSASTNISVLSYSLLSDERLSFKISISFPSVENLVTRKGILVHKSNGVCEVFRLEDLKNLIYLIF